MSHYYENDPNLKSNPKHITFNYRGKELIFLTDAGVFSKAKVDFGSSLLLNSLPKDLDGKRILDIGCGYGPIGLCISKAYPNAVVEMTDVNQRALDLARKNSEINNIRNVQIFQSSLYENISSHFDIIISNPPIRAGKAVVYGIVQGAEKHLVANGELWIVIQKKQGAFSLLKKLEEIFSKTNTVSKDKGYFIFRSIKK